MPQPHAGFAPVRWDGELDSTNAEARRLAEAGAFGPLWIAARRQTAGRGRQGRVWAGGEGNLAATLLTPLDQPPAIAAQLSFVAALAVGQMLGDWAPAGDVRFKWPNDLLLGGRKVSGILIESGRRDPAGLWLAIGVGVNLASAPEGLEPPAASLAAHLPPGRPVPRPEEALASLDRSFGHWFGVWRGEGGFAAVRAAWLERAAGLGQPCTARVGTRSLSGVAEGLGADGALLLRLASGALERITAGEVFFGAPA